MSSEEQTPDTPLQTENIFEEFADTQTQEEVKAQTNKKGMYEYLSLGNKFIMTVNIVLLVLLFLGFLYIFMQKSESKNEWSFLSPICSFFLGNAASEYAPASCYNVYGSYSELESQVSNVKKSQTTQITPLLSELYGLENFNYSKKVSFLLDTTVNRMKPLDMLQEFDAIKNTYSPIDKSEIQCYDITFGEGKIMRMTCDAYSSDWDTAIAGLSEGILVYDFEGSSITRASSFMNYVENAPGSPFTILSKTENLNYVSVQLGPYTQKTTFQLELEYASENISL